MVQDASDPVSKPPLVIAPGTWQGVGVKLGNGVGVRVRVAVGGVPVTVGVGVPCNGWTVSQVAITGPQVSKPWNWFKPRPLTKITCLPTGTDVVSMVASTDTVCEPPKLPFIGIPVPPAHGGVSM